MKAMEIKERAVVPWATLCILSIILTLGCGVAASYCIFARIGPPIRWLLIAQAELALCTAFCELSLKYPGLGVTAILRKVVLWKALVVFFATLVFGFIASMLPSLGAVFFDGSILAFIVLVVLVQWLLFNGISRLPELE